MLYLNNIFHDKYIIPPLVIGLTEASVGRHFILQRHQFLNYYAFLILNYVFFFYHRPNQKYWLIAVTAARIAGVAGVAAARIAVALRLPLHKIYPIRIELKL